MAKIVDYPRASLENSLQLAEAVASLGGACSVDMAAHKMGRKVSGAFSALVSAAVKYSLVSSKDGKLSTQPLFRSIKLAYTEDEKKARLSEALLSPPLFKAVVDRFSGNQLPTEHFEKLLIREFDVPEDIASRVAQYFLQGAKQSGLLSQNGVVTSGDVRPGSSTAASDEGDDADAADSERRDNNLDPVVVVHSVEVKSNEYSIAFKGPGLNSTVVVREEEDLMIVDAMLRKVRKALSSMNIEQ